MKSKGVLKIENVIRMSDGSFISLEEATRAIPDTLFEDTENRCEPLGIYKLIVNGNVFMDESYFDSIIDMWGYFINAVEDFLNGDPAEIGFFDQPITLKMIPDRNQSVKLVLDPCVDTVRAVLVSRDSFLKEFVRAGYEFFRIWVDYDKARSEESVSSYFERIKKIESVANKELRI